MRRARERPCDGNRGLRAIGLLYLASAGLAGVLAGCEFPLDDQLWTCADSSDCGAGWQCNPINNRCVEAYDNGVNGVFDDRIVIGMSTYLEDSNPALVFLREQMVGGINAYFNHVNSTGGIHGRRLELLLRDDGFDPVRTAANFEEMVGAGNQLRKVFLVSSVLGEPASLAAAQLAVREEVLLWAPATGLSDLEPDPPDRYVFNYRPRYEDEAEQLARYLRTEIDPPTPRENVAVFAQGFDTEGNLNASGAEIVGGAARGLGIAQAELAVETSVMTATVVVEPARRFIKWMASPERVETEGVRCVGFLLGVAWEASSAFIRIVSEQLSAARLGRPLNPAFASDLTPEEIARLATVEPRWTAYSANELMALQGALRSFGTYTWIDSTGNRVQRSFGARMVISQVVPFSGSNSSGALRYRQHLAALSPDLVPSGFSLESYLTARLLGEALEKHGRDLTTESFVETLESFSADLGVGTSLGFTFASHQAASRLWAAQFTEDLNIDWIGFLLREP